MYGKMFHNSIVFQSAKIHIYFETDVKNVANEQIIFPPEEILSRSRGNFEGIYRPKIDGIPLFQLHPIVNRFMIGYE